MPDFTDTRSYEALKEVYNAGVAGDQQTKDRIISKGTQAFIEDHKAYSVINAIPSTNNTDVQSYDSSELFNIYKNDVEFVNSFIDQVQLDEKGYFEKKYSPAVYKYLIEKRDKYVGEQENPKKVDSSDNDVCINRINKDISDNDEKHWVQFNNFFNKISELYPSVSSSTTYRKIEYRDKEHEILTTLNSIINIIYYFLFFIMVILLASSNRLLIKERFLIYLLLLILPFLYPYVFELGKKIFDYYFIGKPIHGPKNAFVEIPPPNIDAFDI